MDNCIRVIWILVDYNPQVDFKTRLRLFIGKNEDGQYYVGKHYSNIGESTWSYSNQRITYTLEEANAIFEHWRDEIFRQEPNCKLLDRSPID